MMMNHDPVALKALILNNNDISSIVGLSALRQLNALGNSTASFHMMTVFEKTYLIYLLHIL